MPTYQWKGKNRYGDVVGGVRMARSVNDLSQALERGGNVIGATPTLPGVAFPILNAGC